MPHPTYKEGEYQEGGQTEEDGEGTTMAQSGKGRAEQKAHTGYGKPKEVGPIEKGKEIDHG